MMSDLYMNRQRIIEGNRLGITFPFIELEKIQQVIQIKTLIQFLKDKVGNPVSYSSLARDLQCSDKTVKR
jgi:predicted AAA+ superfamily ATPase